MPSKILPPRCAPLISRSNHARSCRHASGNAQDGVTLVALGGTGDDSAYLVTSDPQNCPEDDMHEESEFLD